MAYNDAVNITLQLKFSRDDVKDELDDFKKVTQNFHSAFMDHSPNLKQSVENAETALKVVKQHKIYVT